MSNYYATARSNYVHIDDMEGLVNSLEPFPIEISEGHDDTFCFLADDPDSGSWPYSVYLDDDTEIEFSFKHHIMPFVKEGECLIIMEVGAEKLRYLIGYASAFVRVGEVVSHIHMSLNDIYGLAADELGCENITSATY